MNDSKRIKVSVFMAKSMDGFIARPDGDVSWLHTGEPLPDGDDAGYTSFFGTIDVLVLGRGSFEKVLTFDPWPYGTTPVVVMSSSLTQIPEKLRDSVRIDRSTLEDLLDKLANQGFKHVYLDGGRVIQSFLRADLVDEMTLTTIPVLIGSGIPLFGELEQDVHLKHMRTHAWDNGMVQSTYKVLSNVARHDRE